MGNDEIRPFAPGRKFVIRLVLADRRARKGSFAELDQRILTTKGKSFEIDLIRRALEQTANHQSRAAQLLGLNATTLNSKIKSYGIARQLTADRNS